MILRHFIIIFIFGIISITSYLLYSNKENLDLYNFQFFSILFIWLLLLILIFNISWFDDKTNIYFIFIILFSLIPRISRYNSIEISKGLSYISILFTSGLLIKSLSKLHIKSSFLILGIILIEYLNLEDIY